MLARLKKLVLPTDPDARHNRPGIRGGLIAVLVILALQAMMLPGVFIYAAFSGGAQAFLVNWWDAIISTPFPGSIALIYGVLYLVVLTIMNIYLLVHFLKKKKGIGTVYFAVLAVGVLFALGDGLISTFLTLEKTQASASHGLVVGLAVMQYLKTSKRAKITFTR